MEVEHCLCFGPVTSECLNLVVLMVKDPKSLYVRIPFVIRIMLEQGVPHL